MVDQPLTLLTVDDNEMVLGVLSEYLAGQGYRVLTAGDGVEALRTLAEEHVDLMLLDVKMPGLSGFDVLRSLRQTHSADDLPVIMATAQGESKDVVKAFELGANDYVTKPLDLPVVLVRVQTRLRGRAPAPPPDPGPGPASGLVTEPETVLDGKYRLESRIGQGQYGVVYRATHLQLDRPVAVKLLRTDLDDDSDDPRARFHREGMSACKLQHPNAVSVLDFSITPTGVPFMVMELLSGLTLEEELKRVGRMTPQRCAELLLPICEVLAEAHSLGIIHRDVKPQNIFLHRGHHGEVLKVLDFGIAKLVGETRSHQRLTLEGIGPGTPTYMAPERFSGGDYDHSADVYSVGVLLYEMLVGRPPFVSLDGNAIKVALKHIGEPPTPLTDYDPDLPKAVETAVLEALRKDPEQRPTALALALNFAVASTSEDRQEAASEAEPDAADPSPATVLVVDDEELVRVVTQEILEDAGFEVVLAEDGPQAIEAYRRHAPEVSAVLLDMTMPELDGAATFRELRRRWGDVKVLLTTGHRNPEIVAELTAEGLAGFVQKPFRPDDLVAALHGVLGE